MVTYRTQLYPGIVVFPLPEEAPKKRLCLDLDGTICQYDFPKIVKNFFGVSLDKYAIYAYDLADVLGVAPTLINLMFKEQVYGKPDFIAGAIETLWEWKGRYELVILSNRIKYMGCLELARWLIDNQIPFDKIDEDGSMAYDYHIDDSPAKLMMTNSRAKLLYSQSWNLRCLDITNSLHRVIDWAQIRQIIEGNEYA